MNYGTIKKTDIANGPGVRVSLFVSGCRNHCKGCFQPETWDFDYGDPFTTDTEDEILEYLAPDHIRGLTLLGGDPMEPENQKVLLPLLSRIKNTYPDKDIWAFTGFTWESIHDKTCRANTDILEELFSYIDVLVDGPFVEDLKDLRLRFRGSSNQRLIDVQKTLSSGTVTIWDDGLSLR